MKKAIKKAVEGGYNGISHGNNIWSGINTNTAREYPELALSDPAFWQCLGKSLRWDIMPSAKITMYQYDGVSKDPIEVKWTDMYVWRAQWHRFIDHLAEGKSADSFFEDLLT